MAKAINWPIEFYEEVISEDMDSQKTAARLGSLYFDNGYYTNKEIIDIRVNHKVARKAVIDGEMHLLKIKDISDSDMLKFKKGMQSKSDLINFLIKNYSKYYKEPINEETKVTLITYKNLDIVPFEHDDPHMQ